MSTAESNKHLVRDTFMAWVNGDPRAFFRLFADDLRWTVIGTTPVSRTYTSRRDFFDNATKPLNAKLATPIMPTLINVLADGDHIVLQWQGRATMASGKPYNNSYCWVMRLADGKVKEGIAYLDTELASALMRT